MQLRRLESLLHESQLGLGSASSHLESLRKTGEYLKTELETTQVALVASTHSSKEFKVSYDQILFLFLKRNLRNTLKTK